MSSGDGRSKVITYDISNLDNIVMINEMRLRNGVFLRKAANGNIFIGTRNNVIYFDPKTFAEIWKIESSNFVECAALVEDDNRLLLPLSAQQYKKIAKIFESDNEVKLHFGVVGITAINESMDYYIQGGDKTINHSDFISAQSSAGGIRRVSSN